jgi:hypothetical protein
MKNGEVNEPLLVSQASGLVATTISEIERLRAATGNNVYPHGIGKIFVSIKDGEDAVQLTVESAEVLVVSRPGVAKHTMVYSITPAATSTNSSATTQITNLDGSPVAFIKDGQEHTIEILA